MIIHIKSFIEIEMKYQIDVLNQFLIILLISSLKTNYIKKINLYQVEFL